MSIIANAPAIVARRKVRKNGSISTTATRVAGKDPLNITTPSKPFSQPEAEPGAVLYAVEFTTMTSRCGNTHYLEHLVSRW
ncbi:hypothetical protein ACEPRU_14855 [Raoultella ornithinolytica]|uniref:hypothetical protein n=1 Tax=Raoultella ornithinolytica TaxID=54291 RepID=UPI001780B301